ncbi:F0F1 ATP synthase subunit A [Lichenicola cladoniae]|uniref:ATP synthase subunit a n=1 Tax=Lichenicola cladoniae TaxID=1484109 RepID=A0A6M8HUX2_9PROT|nr:F0F1 ATP synthase subunit A [Lichenicola cladoniae]NPD66183.1 F0F1 ATP synthase subunit A [Acetobacteraceae bacterium]QKE92046.1 F0F1 ATP synthase subunit A [Lichenicola cladoniae]
MAGGHSIDALGQFELHPVLGSLGASLRFSQSSLVMVIAAALILALLYVGMRPRALVPGRLQAAAEIMYDFIYTMATDQIGHEGRRFFPFIFTLFAFILVGNYIGLVPGSFTFTSHIAVTAALSILVFVVGLLVALREQGFKFFGHFMPEGAPVALAPLLVPIEILSYLSRPISLSVRLFANMMAGHVMFEMFAAFTIMLGGIHYIGPVLGIAPLAINVALMALELLVGGLQAYVFAILTCIYLREAVAH